MDDTTFAVAILPPFLAVICELLNPVSEAALTLQGFQVVDDMGLVQPPNPMTPANADEYYGHRTAIAHAIGKMATGAAEVSGVIPTFISVSTAAVATLHELPFPLLWIILPFFLASTFAILASYCFSHISYFRIATLPFRWNFNARWLSLCLITSNLVLILFCTGVWLHSRSGFDTKEQIQQLNLQIGQLRDQVAELDSSRGLEQEKSTERDAQISQLAKELNKALEVIRYRANLSARPRRNHR